MPKRLLTVDWKSINGAAIKKRILQLRENTDGLYLCPIQACLHLGFKSSRGLRKHINNTHCWYYYFNEQPVINRDEAIKQTRNKVKTSTHKMPAFALETGAGKDFLEWLQTPCGGGKCKKEAIQIARRGMKFLMASMGECQDNQYANDEYIDCCVGSPSIVMNFLKVITEEWDLASSGALTYMKAISDLLDYRKASGVSDNVLRSFAVTEVYIRRGKENLAKKKKIEYARNLDLETLIARNSWATVQEMEAVIPYHTPKYESLLKKCNEKEHPPSVSEFSFTTRFIATFLFLRVKSTRPMTFQFITLRMLSDAQENGGFIDQTAFKTRDKYAFDTLVLTEDVLEILDTYVKTVRPMMNPSCDYLLVTTNGTQYRALGTAMSLLVHQAIGKYVNPTRYRQIVESESAVQLSTKERETISKDQKHSSYVAKRIYQKRLSRDVALEGRACMQKMVGADREKHTKELASSLRNIEISTDSKRASSTLANSQSSDSAIPSQSTSGDFTDNCILSTDLSHGDEVIYDDDNVCIEDAGANTGKVTSEARVNVVPDDDNYREELQTQEFAKSSEEKEEEESTLQRTGAFDVVDVDKCDSEEKGISNRIPTSTLALSNPQLRDEVVHNLQLNIDDVEVKKEELENELARGTRFKRFTIEEDAFLKEGVRKYGIGKWSQMLRDSELKFQPSRTRDSLRMRAETIGITKKRKRKTK